MDRDPNPPDRAGPEGAGRLRRLLEVEDRLEAELREHRHEAAGIVAAAEDEAESLRRAASDRLETEAAALEARIRAACDREVAAIRAEAEARARRWSDADDAMVDALAGLVLDRVSGGGAG